MTDKKFVLSSSEFDQIKDAENKINGWFQSGEPKLTRKTKLYKVTEVYSIRLKFYKQKV